MKDIFSEHAPRQDDRTKAKPFFLINLVMQFMGDSKQFSLESIRRSINSTSGTPISRSTFWERLTTKVLGKRLSSILNDTTKLLSSSCGIDPKLMQSLGVTGLSYFDSTIITLRDNASQFFDGTFTLSAIKFHLESDGISGALKWAILSAASVHDNCAFPSIDSLVGRLSVFDLGYFDWPRFKEMNELGAFFLSRLKSNATVYIHEIVCGLGKKHQGKKLGSLSFKRSRGNIIKFNTFRKIDGHKVRFRVIGFWNPILKKYHWYVTNLECEAIFIAPLYRLRWQLELLIKSAKQSLNLNQITTENENIIINLCTAKLIALTISMIIRKIGLLNMQDERRYSISLQRSAMVLTNLAKDFVNYIIDALDGCRALLRGRINAMLGELYDPNYKRRRSSMQAVVDMAYGVK